MAMEFDLDNWIELALREDLGKEGDISTLASIPQEQRGTAQLWAKEAGCFAGQIPFEKVFKALDSGASCQWFVQDGDSVQVGTLVAEVEGPVHTLLSGERLALNIVQRMSAIATQTKQWVALAGTGRTRLLDTRKTTPMFRYFEKEAVRIGGGMNHRFGLYDMVMLKDNHIDAAGGITLAVERTRTWLSDKGLDRKIEVETRHLNEVKEALACLGIHRIMFRRIGAFGSLAKAWEKP